MYKFFVGLANKFIAMIGYVINSVILLLPDSPFQSVNNNDVSQYMGVLNWLVPIPAILTILEAWLVAVTAYYVLSVALRWIKAI